MFNKGSCPVQDDWGDFLKGELSTGGFSGMRGEANRYGQKSDNVK